MISASVEPKTRAFLEAVAAGGGPAIYELSVTDARGVLSGLQAGGPPRQPADIEDRTLPVGPGGSVSVRIFRPKGAAGPLPAIVYFHGGGWVLGDKDTHDRLVRELVAGSGAAAVFVNFTPAPEAKYPTQIEEAYAAAKWVVEHGASVGLDPARVALAGDSVGGNMTIAVTLLAKQRGGPKFVAQVLFYPVTDAAFDTPSYHEFATEHFLSREAMKWFWGHYAPNAASHAEPTCSPLRATTEQLAGLPPALVITAETDVLRDEGEAYARKLAAAGVTTTAVRYNGTIHDFVMLHAVADTPAAIGATAQAVDFLRRVFGK